jgi:hypothetical protein
MDEFLRMKTSLTHQDSHKPSWHYVVLKWNEGWQDVVEIDKASVDLLRYYVLEKAEAVGRTTFETKEHYPHLLRVDRLLQEMDRLLIR